MDTTTINNDPDPQWIKDFDKEHNMALPKDYEMSDTSQNYMRFVKGENRFRIMSDWIVGYEWWVDVDEGRKPMRRRKDEQILPDELEGMRENDKIKEFWAGIVFDYADDKIKILEITQKSIMRTLMGLENDEDWGDAKGPNGYDIVVHRKGEGLETKYEVRAKPKKALDEGVVRMYKDTYCNLEALYAGDDPFDESVKVADEAAEVLGGKVRK